MTGGSTGRAVRCSANERQALAKMCRYIPRPALANGRVQTIAAAHMVLKCKTTWRDGNTHLVMAPLDAAARWVPALGKPDS